MNSAHSGLGISQSVPTTNGPDVFFDRALDAFHSTGNLVDRHFFIGGYHLRLRFAGPALISLITPALAHLAEPPRPAVDLTICLWDSKSTGVSMPPPPWEAKDYYVRGEIRGFNTETLRTTFNLGSGVLSILDTSKDLAIYWIRDFRQLPYYESGAPLLTIMNWWMGAHRRQVVHAGAVGTARGGVLLVGRGGSGKSSTTLSCLNAGLSYLSDDYCLVSTDPIPYVYSIFSSGKVNAEDLGRFPTLEDSLSNGSRLGQEKALFFLHEKFNTRIVTGLPLRAIFLPRIAGGPETRIKKASPSASLLALAPSTIFQLPGAGHEVFDSLSDLVRVLPSYVLELGTERASIPSVISEFLAGE